MKMAGVWEVSQSETHQTNEIGMEDRNNLSRASSHSYGSDVEEEGWQSGTSWRSTGDQEWPVESNPSVLVRNRSFQPDQTKYGFLPGENYLIHPESMQHRIWWAFIAFMAAFTALYVPYSVGFATYNSVPPYGSGAGAMQILLDVVFFMDMLVQFNLAFRVENTNELIVDRRTIATRYLGGKFGVDLIGLFPFHPLVLGIAGKMQQPTSKFGMYSSLSRLLQLVRIYRMGQLQEKLLFWQALSLKDIIIARIVLVLFFLGNIFACGFYFIAILEGVDVDSFMSEFLSLHGPLNGLQRYILTFYYMASHILSTVGYGDFIPVSAAEQVWCMICIIMAISNLAHIQFSFFLIAKSDPKSGMYRDASKLIKHYCKSNSRLDLEPSMQKYLKMKFVETEKSDEDVIGSFPLAVKAKILSHVYQDVFAQHPLFLGVDPSYLEEFITRGKVEVFVSGTKLVEQGMIPARFYVLLAGKVRSGSFSEKSLLDSFGNTLDGEDAGNWEPHGAIQGMISDVGFLTRTPQTYTVEAWSTCRTLTLTRTAFDELSEKFPVAAKKLYTNLLVRLRSEVQLLNLATQEGQNRAERIKGLDAEFWLPKHRKAIDSVRMSISRYGNKRTAGFLQKAFSGDLPGIQRAISEGFDINSSNYDGRTALIIAAARGFSPIVKALLEAGANVDQLDSRSHSALLEAVIFGHETTMKLLMKCGATLSTPPLKQASVLCMATYEGDLALVERLLEAGVSPNVLDYGGRTALDIAVSLGNLPAVKLLASYGGIENANGRWAESKHDNAALMKKKVDMYHAL